MAILPIRLYISELHRPSAMLYTYSNIHAIWLYDYTPIPSITIYLRKRNTRNNAIRLCLLYWYTLRTVIHDISLHNYTKYNHIQWIHLYSYKDYTIIQYIPLYLVDVYIAIGLYSSMEYRLAMPIWLYKKCRQGTGNSSVSALTEKSV